ncbi:hypothetical protein SAMN02745121_07520 [Nannocystis exedens]|uniref:Lipoprotein n=1 Tax=Nannocystis exedens TaxID=54 RepID=A0A1I2GWT5_9BACT|nr:hypothetical protein [Nannocystis exedens]PCC74081.1 hypothetical protein NAEX_07170 [Nannocystis exedens]SFF21031.1 hypothetical protein SAMN02745121_07520 [Nannocystis exedens]
MREFNSLVYALALAACGGGSDDDDDSNNGQVSDELAGYCLATFTADHELLNPLGDVALRVETGQRYLLTGLPDSPAIVYQHRDGAFDLELDVGTAPIDAPCLADGAALTSEYVAFAQLDVYSDQALQNRVCTIEKFMAGGPVGYGYVANNVYEVLLDGGFCDGLETGFVPATTVMVGDMGHVGVPILQLFQLQE